MPKQTEETQPEETKPKKSPITKYIEGFTKFNLQQQEEILAFTKEIHLSHLKQKEEDLAAQLHENQAKQEKLK